jgi:hypothetical protein
MATSFCFMGYVFDHVLLDTVNIIGVDPDNHLLNSGPTDFETWIDWIHRTTKKKTRNHKPDLEMVMSSLQYAGEAADGRLHLGTSETSTVFPFLFTSNR